MFLLLFFVDSKLPFRTFIQIRFSLVAFFMDRFDFDEHYFSVIAGLGPSQLWRYIIYLAPDWGLLKIFLDLGFNGKKLFTGTQCDQKLQNFTI